MSAAWCYSHWSGEHRFSRQHDVFAQEILSHDSVGCGVAISTIQRAVCEYFGITRDELLGHGKVRRIARPRQVGYWLCYHLTGKSYPEIALRFKRADHTTVLHGIHNVRRLAKLDPEFRDDVWMLYRDLIEAHA